MLNPSIGKLIHHYDNRYRLVMDVAREARKTSEEAIAREEILIEKPVSLAIDKLAKKNNL